MIKNKNSWGVLLSTERRQALGLSPSKSPRGGLRRSPNGLLIDAVGGDSYGK